MNFPKKFPSLAIYIIYIRQSTRNTKHSNKNIYKRINVNTEISPKKLLTWKENFVFQTKENKYEYY